MRKIIILLVLTISINSVFAQKSVNNYKYIVVPHQFEFLRSPDQYQLNSLAKFLFEKAGFETYKAKEKTTEVVENNCLVLEGRVVDESSMFTTKLKIQLVDCYNVVVFESKIGKTKEKEFKKAYHEALREAFEDIQNLDYKYVPASDTKIIEKKVDEVKVVVEKTAEAEEVKQVVEVKKPKERVEPGVEKGEVELVNKKPAEVLKRSKKIKAKAVKKEKQISKSIVGKYIFEQWGMSEVSAEGDYFVLKGGDENFQFATLYKTSMPNAYIIKYVTHKQPRLVKITSEGNLKVDSKNGVEVIKRAN